MDARPSPLRAWRHRFLLTATLVLLLIHRPGRTCSLATPADHVVDPGEQQADTQPPAAPEVTGVSVRQPSASGGGCGGSTSGASGSCGDVGFINIAVRATDDRTASADMGYKISLASGSPPSTLKLPTKAIRASEPTGLFLYWTGDATDLDFELQIFSVDRGGNVSATATVARVRSEREGGCSVARLPGGAGSQSLLFVAAAAIAWTGRRRVRSRIALPTRKLFLGWRPTR
jgi:hypothetical protein